MAQHKVPALAQMLGAVLHLCTVCDGSTRQAQRVADILLGELSALRSEAGLGASAETCAGVYLAHRETPRTSQSDDAGRGEQRVYLFSTPSRRAATTRQSLLAACERCDIFKQALRGRRTASAAEAIAYHSSLSALSADRERHRCGQAQGQRHTACSP